MVRYLIIYLLLYAFCSCSDWQTRQQLDAIEPLAMTDPQEAQRQLDSLRLRLTDISKNKALQARFYLLDAHIKYKNKSLTASDTTLLIAERYYYDHGSDYERMLCKILVGFWYCTTKQMLNTAITKNKEALEEDRGGDLHYLRGETCTALFWLYLTKEDTVYVKYAESALDAYVAEGNPSNIIQGQLNLGFAYHKLGNQQAALRLLRQALRGAEAIGDTVACCTAHCHLSGIFARHGESDSALCHYRLCREKYGYELNNHDYDIMAWAYARKGDREQAEACLDSALTHMEQDHRQKLYLALHYRMAAQIYERLGDETKAKEVSLREQELNSTMHRHDAKELAGQFDALKAEYKVHRAAEEKMNDRFFMAITSALLVILSTITALAYRQRRHSKLELEVPLWSAAVGESDVKTLVETMKNTECVRHITELAQKRQLLNNATRAELNRLFERMYPSFNHTLSQRITLTAEKRTICQLQKLGFLNVQIATLMAVTPNAISNTSKRNCEEYLHGEGSAAQWRQIIQSL